MHSDNYVIKSLELHLFFGRIMKEHALFLKAGFTPANASFSSRATFFQNRFEQLLSRALSLSKGGLREPVLCSGELVTEFTDLAERQTELLTGIPINRSITDRTLKLCLKGHGSCDLFPKHREIKQLNQTALRLLDGLIRFKETILDNVLCCKMFTMNYPLLIEHIIREAKLYRDYVRMLENDGDLCDQNMKETECFWNQIMMEHALFIRGLLDPSETELFLSAHEFARNYSALLEHCRSAHKQTMTAESLEETLKFRDFKAAGTRGIAQCQIRSIILPLLTDHVLREANHYIRLLNC